MCKSTFCKYSMCSVFVLEDEEGVVAVKWHTGLQETHRLRALTSTHIHANRSEVED